MTTSERPERLTADPHGDVKLIISASEDAKELRVSSKVMSLASSVFAALLSPKFSEGVTLSHAKDVHEIKLEDDDPEAMLLICHTIHLGHHIPRRVPIDLLEKVALLCDKYDLAKALSGWSERWLLGHITGTNTEDTLITLVCLSYIFEQHGAFFSGSSKLFLSYPMMISKCLSQDHNVTCRVPEYSFSMSTQALVLISDTDIKFVVAAIQKERQALGLALAKAIEDPMFRIVHYTDNTMRHYIGGLLKAELLSVSGLIHRTVISLSVAIEQHQICERTSNCSCSTIRLTVPDAVRGALGNAGLCLTCVRMGNLTKQDGNCGASERDFCTGSAQSNDTKSRGGS